MTRHAPAPRVADSLLRITLDKWRAWRRQRIKERGMLLDEIGKQERQIEILKREQGFALRGFKDMLRAVGRRNEELERRLKGLVRVEIYRDDCRQVLRIAMDVSMLVLRQHRDEGVVFAEVMNQFRDELRKVMGKA